jgi:hypothetical protein
MEKTMKIDLNMIDREQFTVKAVNIKGVDEPCYLINPSSIDTKWTPMTFIYRSSLWNSAGELISAGYKKFFNWPEHPELVNIPDKMAGLILMEKIDGSCLIVSRYRGNTIVRTRGTADATLQDNGAEIAVLKEIYPKAFEWTEWSAGYSRIFKWTTPSNRIVLDYGGKPQLWYTGKIYHEDYRYAKQDELDEDALVLKVQRPKAYQFGDLTEMMTAVEAFKGIEGICVYFNNGQDIRKVKGAEYLALHRFKSMCSFDNVLDIYLEMGCPSYDEFEQKLTSTFDFECMNMAKPYAQQICEDYKEVQAILNHMQVTVHGLRHLPTRKEQAMTIVQAYGQVNRAGFAFAMLDDKPMKKADVKKLIYQVTKL